MGKLTSGVLTALLAGGLIQTASAANGGPSAKARESLLSNLYPGERYQWTPNQKLKLEVSPEHFQRVLFPSLALDGGGGEFYGVSGIEVGTDKRDYIRAIQSFQAPPPTGRRFLTTLVVFRTDSSGNLLQCSKLLTLDSSDPLAEIKILHPPRHWPSSGWPRVYVQYQSWMPSRGSYTVVEWRAWYDPNTKRIVARIPIGIVTDFKDGRELMRMFVLRRVSPSEIQITDGLNNVTKPYACGTPCVVDRAALLAQWGQ